MVPTTVSIFKFHAVSARLGPANISSAKPASIGQAGVSSAKQQFESISIVTAIRDSRPFFSVAPRPGNPE
jgi:hypothetical protein